MGNWSKTECQAFRRAPDTCASKNLQFPDKPNVSQIRDTVGLIYILFFVAPDFLATNEVIFILMAQTTRQERYLLLQTGTVNKFSF